MQKDPMELERDRLKRVARDYIKKGYSVDIEPKLDILPRFLRDFQPDMIAHRKDENVVVEIKSSTALSKSKYLTKLADAVQSEKGWRFELIVINPRALRDFKEDRTMLSLTAISERNSEVSKLVKQRSYEAAFLLLWSAIEAALKQTAVVNNVEFRNENPIALVKTLYSYGLLRLTDLHRLEEAFSLRNSLVHGFRTNTLTRQVILRTQGLLRWLISLLQNSG